MSNQQLSIHLQTTSFLSKEINTTAFIWGGLVPDIYLGKILRPHDDIDYLVLNLKQHFVNLEKRLQKYNYNTEKLANGDLKASQDDFKIHLGDIEIHNDKFRWFHDGEKNVLKFPIRWLNFEPHDFLGITVHVIRPEMQLYLKENPTVLNPNWTIRNKDKTDSQNLKIIINYPVKTVN